MKYLLAFYIFLLPFHAIWVTYLKCRAGIDMDILRFWKEMVILGLLGIVSYQVLKKYHFNLEKIYKNNSILWLVTAFSLTSLFYIYFPYFNPKVSSYLGFKYDVFFLFALLVGYYLSAAKQNFDFLLKSLFTSIGVMLIVFLPWYVSGNIASTTEIFGFDSTPSTYEANGCISFSQNVTGGHNRFQGSFWDPIRFSVFLTVFYFFLIGYILEKKEKSRLISYGALLITSSAIFASIFFAFTKTSILGLLFWIVLFLYLVRKIIYQKTFSKKFIIGVWSVVWVLLFAILYLKRNLFLHPEAILGRVENLITSIQMFFWNPFGYGLGIAGPASQLGTSSDTFLSGWVTKFLPENWYVQLLLEQSILGLGLFVAIVCVLGIYLYRIMKKKKDFLSIGIFTGYITILFMANFTHIFEETATSFILFLLVWAYIAKEMTGEAWKVTQKWHK